MFFCQQSLFSILDFQDFSTDYDIFVVLYYLGFNFFSRLHLDNALFGLSFFQVPFFQIELVLFHEILKNSSMQLENHH